MSFTKSFQKKIILIIPLIVASLGLFFAGVLAHRYGLHNKIPGASRVIGFIDKNLIRIEKPFFYPAPEQGLSEIFQKKDVKYPFTFIVYGDSREEAGSEKDALIAKIIEENPSFVIYTGDMVSYSEEHQWKIFDLFDGKIVDSGIPFYPVLGNHEYRARDELYPLNPEGQLRHYFGRFRFLEKRRWYSFRYENSLFLILDTNTDYSPGSHQYKWLIDRLKEKSPGFLFIAFHHSPYTKNEYKAIRKSEKFLAGILESCAERGIIKADIVFSGHTHNYERYRHNGINYVVSGGGGTLQHPVDRDPNDFYNKPGETFHYCKIAVSETEAIFEMVSLQRDSKKWTVADTFTISK